jgi:PHAX RNA-binding domain
MTDHEPSVIDNESSLPVQREPSQLEVAAMIADQLGETEASVRQSIVRIVKALGRTQAREMLNFTLQAEEHGGLMVPDGSRRRTPGGVFFYYVHTIGIPKPGKSLPVRGKATEKAKKPNAQPVKPKNTKSLQKATEKPVNAHVIAFTWDDRIAVIREAEQEKGQTTTLKITVIGRPGKVLDKGTFIVTVMESTKVPALPKGLPTPTDVATKYDVYISSKQWNKVKDAITDPEDSLIIEGYPRLDTEVSAIAVFATNVTTKKLQMAKKQPQAAQ